MAARRKRSNPNDAGEVEALSTGELLRRLCNAVALGLVKGDGQAEKIAVLNAIGYTAPEIARLIDTNPGNVNQHLYLWRQGKTKKNKRKAPTSAADT